MKISGKINVVILSIMVVIGIGTVVVVLFVFDQVEKSELELMKKQSEYSIVEKSNSFMDTINGRIELIGKRALGIASLFSRDPLVTEAYEIALSGNIDDPESPQSQKARDMLRGEFAPILEGYIKNTGEKELKLHFHLPNARSLVRLWRKGYQTVVNGKKVDISDDISAFRETVKKVNTPPYKPITGIEIGRGGFVIRGLAPVEDSTGKHLGSVEVLFPFKEVMVQDKENSLKKGSLFYAVFMDADKLPIAKSLQNAEKYPVIESKYVLTDSTERELANRLINRNILDIGHRTVYRGIQGKYHLTAFPIKDFSGVPVGVMTFAFDVSTKQAALDKVKEEIVKEKGYFIFVFIAIIVVLAILGILITILVVRSIIRPLNKLDEALKKIASGYANLKQRIEIGTKDEIGSLGESFNSFLDKMHQIIGKIKETVETTISVQESLGASNEETLAAITEITANINSAKDMIHTLSGKIDNAGNNSENIKRNIEELDKVIGDQAASVEQASASVNEMVASVENVAKITQGRQKATEELVRHTKTGEEIVMSAMTAVKEIGDSVEGIGEMVRVIKDISAKTNLLAMNAAIEAAHAGEAGKGFSVVADEIRKLAENVASESKDISSELEDMIRKIEGAVNTGDRAGKSFVKIRKEVEDTFDALSEIATSSYELSNGGKEVLNAVSKLSEVTVKVKEDSGNITKNVEGLDSIMKEVARIASEVIGAMDEITVGTTEINRAVEQTVGLTTLLADSASTLKGEVDNFDI